MREKRVRTFSRGLIVFLVLVAGPVLSGCLPLPIVDSQGVLKGSALDPSGRIHVVTDGYNGIHYGVIDTIWMNPELVTSEGTLGDSYGYPFGAGRDVLALDPSGNPHVLYYSNSGAGPFSLYGELTHAWKESGGWASEVIGTLDHCGVDFLSHPAIAVDSSGDIHVSYVDMDCEAPAIVVRYARKHEGTWMEEVIETVVDLGGASIPVLVCRIGLGPDQEPVVAIGLGGADMEGLGSYNVIHVAQPMEGGGWVVEEIFECPGAACSVADGGGIKDLSLAVGPSGEKAVAFRVIGYEWGRMYLDYKVMVDEGSGWVTDFVCYDSCDDHAFCDCQAQDIAYDPAGRLYSMFTRVWLESPYPDILINQSIVLAHRTDTGWPEETLWDNTIYDVPIDYSYSPELLFTSASQAKIVYRGPTLMYLTK